MARRKRIITGAFAGALAALSLSILLLSGCSFDRSDLFSETSHDGSAPQQPDVTGAEPTAEDTGEADRPEGESLLVPVAHLSSEEEDVTLDGLSGTQDLAVAQGTDEEAANALLPGGTDLSVYDTASEVLDHVSTTPGSLGLVPWDEVDPRVKALSVEGRSLLSPGVQAEDYPLGRGGAAGPEPDGLRRVVVGGDIVLDRGQVYAAIEQNRGLDFSLDGGYAAITSRSLVPNPYAPSALVHQFSAERRGETGRVREYLRGADLALANFENPVLRDAIYHPEAASFTGDLRLLPILQRGGIDGVTLANNHVMDAGPAGLEETLGHLDEAGISHAGAGVDLDAARRPMIFDLGGITVGVLSYQNVPNYEWAWAAEGYPGTAPFTEDVMREDVEKLKDRVDLVVVMPHWGREYIAEPEPGQVELARAAVDAGADLVVGDHAHWPKGMEVYGGRPIFYGTGNFLFDQSWSEETSTGIFVEAILYKDRVVQAKPVPFIILDQAQPNFLLPESGGNRALQTIFGASLGPEFAAYRPTSGD